MSDLDLELCQTFLDEADEMMSKTEACFLNLESASTDPSIVENIFRLVHNFKGSAGGVGFQDLAHFSHSVESLLLKVKERRISITPELISLLLECNDYLRNTVATLRRDLHATYADPVLLGKVENWAQPSSTEGHPETPASQPKPLPQQRRPPATTSPDDSIRVALSRVDKLMNDVGELVILQTGLSQTRHLLQSAAQLAVVNQMEKTIREVQELTMSLRMIPLTQTFQKLKRIVRDTSLALGKDVEIHVSGEDIELDKSMLEKLVDPLVHILRNALDHGLETPPERTAAGKPPKGSISLSACHSSGRVVLEIRDDGRGLDPKKLVAKAVEKGILPSGSALTDDEAYRLVFAPGFSTKEQVTDVSGRGVGMDVVRTNVTALQGEIDIETKLGGGTVFRISIPLTLAIIEGMIVRVGSERFVIPLVQVSETVQISAENVSTIAEVGQALKLRTETIAIHRLGRVLGRRMSARDAGSVGIVVRGTGRQTTCCVSVDQIVGRQQVVIKRLGDEAIWFSGVMGAAILGDGEAVLILDIHEVLKSHARQNTGRARAKEAA